MEERQQKTFRGRLGASKYHANLHVEIRDAKCYVFNHVIALWMADTDPVDVHIKRSPRGESSIAPQGSAFARSGGASESHDGLRECGPKRERVESGRSHLREQQSPRGDPRENYAIAKPLQQALRSPISYKDHLRVAYRPIFSASRRKW